MGIYKLEMQHLHVMHIRILHLRRGPSPDNLPGPVRYKQTLKLSAAAVLFTHETTLWREKKCVYLDSALKNFHAGAVQQN